MAGVFGSAPNFFSAANQGKRADYGQARQTDESIENVPDIKERSADGVAAAQTIMESSGFCGGLPQSRWRQCAGHFIRAKRTDIARIWDALADRNLVRVLENTRLSARRYAFNARESGRQVIVIVDALDGLGIAFRRT